MDAATNVNHIYQFDRFWCVVIGFITLSVLANQVSGALNNVAQAEYYTKQTRTVTCDNGPEKPKSN